MNITDKPVARALQQGLDLLNLMKDGESRNLESLAIASGLAKSSCLRLLDTLIVEGLVERDPNSKAYRAVMRLAPLMLGRSREREIQHQLMQLSKATDLTAEWWTSTDQGMVLQFRHAPIAKEVQVFAHVGFLYPRNRLEVIPALEHACFIGDQFPDDTVMWNESGKQLPATKKSIKRYVNMAKHGRSYDAQMNGNGVRRIAGLIGRDCLSIGIPPIPRIDDIEKEFGEIFDQYYYSIAATLEEEV